MGEEKSTGAERATINICEGVNYIPISNSPGKFNLPKNQKMSIAYSHFIGVNYDFFGKTREEGKSGLVKKLTRFFSEKQKSNSPNPIEKTFIYRREEKDINDEPTERHGYPYDQKRMEKLRKAAEYTEKLKRELSRKADVRVVNENIPKKDFQKYFNPPLVCE